MRAPIILLTLALSTGATATPILVADPSNHTITHDMRTLPVHVGGRVAASPLPAPMPRGARRFLHQWPGVYFEAAFKGDRVALKFDDDKNVYRLLIDDNAPIPIPPPGQAEIAISGLGDSPHAVRLEKITESNGIARAFDGFYVPREEQPIAVKPRARQIEFIGDSSMTGFGMHAESRICTRDETRTLSDTQNAYPALVARHYDADYQVNAISGRGLLRNYGGDASRPIPVVYPLTLPSSPERYGDPGWRPQVYVITQQADFASPFKTGERWTNWGNFGPDYVRAYGEFVAALHQRSPAASFLIIWLNTSQANAETIAFADAMQSDITNEARQAGVTRIDFLPMLMTGLVRTGCGGHYTVEDSRKLADWVVAYFDGHPGFWAMP